MQSSVLVLKQEYGIPVKVNCGEYGIHHVQCGKIPHAVYAHRGSFRTVIVILSVAHILFVCAYWSE